MKFTTTTALFAFASTALAADGIFSITGSSTPSTVTLQVLNGVVGEAPKCSGTANIGALPASGTIPCQSGYALSFKWNAQSEGIAATYTNPTNTFTYNVPNKGCDGNGNCQFGFENIYPGRRSARDFRV